MTNYTPKIGVQIFVTNIQQPQINKLKKQNLGKKLKIKN